MKAKTYTSPAAFKRALEDRLKGASASGVDLARRIGSFAGALVVSAAEFLATLREV